MSTSAISRLSKLPLERMITTDMSAAIVAGLRKSGFTLEQVATTVGAPIQFIELVRGKKQVFTWKDLKKIGRKTNQTAELVFLNAIEARPGNEPLLAGMRQILEMAARPVSSRAKSPSAKRSAKTRAA